MKIEAGCKAVIVNSEAGNNGVFVKVIRRLPEITYVRNKYGDAWEIDTEVPDTFGVSNCVISERQLKRIDEDSRKVVSWDECVFNPTKKTVDA